jgi:hypothetical protein
MEPPSTTPQQPDSICADLFSGSLSELGSAFTAFAANRILLLSTISSP